jgi:hypothetical protein
MEGELEFFYRGLAVGIFEENSHPTADGEYSYMPYRGQGHYKLMERLKQKGIAVCYYMTDGEKKVLFSVEKSGNRGKLFLSNVNKECNLRNLIDEAISNSNF